MKLCHLCAAAPFTRNSSYYFQSVLAITILFFHLSVFYLYINLA